MKILLINKEVFFKMEDVKEIMSREKNILSDFWISLLIENEHLIDFILACLTIVINLLVLILLTLRKN